jgi:hypothetical protein
MKYYKESRRNGTTYIEGKGRRLNGLVTTCAETAF